MSLSTTIPNMLTFSGANIRNGSELVLLCLKITRIKEWQMVPIIPAKVFWCKHLLMPQHVILNTVAHLSVG